MTNKRVIKISSQFKRDIKRNYLLLATQEWAEVLHFLVSNSYQIIKLNSPQNEGCLI